MPNIGKSFVSPTIGYRSSQAVPAEGVFVLKEIFNRIRELETLALKGELRQYHLDGCDSARGGKFALSTSDMKNYAKTCVSGYFALGPKLEIISGLEAMFKSEMMCRETLDRIRFCEQGIPDDPDGIKKYLKVIFGEEDAPKGSGRCLQLSLVIYDLGGPEAFGITEQKLADLEFKALEALEKLGQGAPNSIGSLKTKSQEANSNKNFDGAPSGGHFTPN